MTLGANSSEETHKPSVLPTNNFSGEDIIPFSDCTTVRQARQRRVARILATCVPAQNVQLTTSETPADQQRIGALPAEVRLLEIRGRST